MARMKFLPNRLVKARDVGASSRVRDPNFSKDCENFQSLTMLWPLVTHQPLAAEAAKAAILTLWAGTTTAGLTFFGAVTEAA